MKTNSKTINKKTMKAIIAGYNNLVDDYDKENLFDMLLSMLNKSQTETIYNALEAGQNGSKSDFYIAKIENIGEEEEADD